MENLEQIRKQIDAIDNQLIELFKQRMDCAKAVGNYKKANNIPILNLQREQEILNEVEAKGEPYGYSAKLLYSNIMELSRALQHTIIGSGSQLRKTVESAKNDVDFAQNRNVAIQGIQGANSHEAATRLFADSGMVFCKTFSDVFDAVENQSAGFGVLPVENSSAGSVSDVYDLILKHRFYIVKALDLKIDYCLCALPQSTLEDIQQVWSHPQALAQCSRYIGNNDLKAVPCSNTAVAAREVAQEKRLNCAAICSRKAAQAYGLNILDQSFQNSQTNTTRFIVISKQLYIPQNADKISLCFSVPHMTGSLYSTLGRFSALGLNLTKIESRPMANKDFEYLFYLDFSGSLYDPAVLDLLCALSDELPEFSFLGNYNETE